MQQSTCCWDNITFTDWQGPDPVKQPNGTYTAEWNMTCNWIGPATFSVSANDENAFQIEDDEPGTDTITIVGVEVASITGPTESFCPAWQPLFTATTNPRGYASLLRWTGGDHPPVVEGTDQYRPTWDTGGQKTVTVKCGSDLCGDSSLTWNANVYEPMHSIEFLPIEGSGGMLPIRVRVRLRCANIGFDSIRLYERELPVDHMGGWQEIRWPLPLYEGRENGVDTWIISWDCEHRWNTMAVHNGEHELKFEADFTHAPDDEDVIHETVYTTTDVLNLSIVNVSPEGVAVWKGEEGTTVPITVNLEDNDFTHPIDLTLTFYPTNQDNRYGWSPCGSLSVQGITSPSYTF